MSSPHSPQLESALRIYAAALPRHARLLELAGAVLLRLAVVQADLSQSPDMAAQEIEASLDAGRPASPRLPISAAIFQDTLARLLDLFRQFDLIPKIVPEQFQNLLSLEPSAWLNENALEAVCRGRDLPAGLLFFLGQKALSPFYHQAAAHWQQQLLQADWQRGQCPFCGQLPVLASLTPDSGQKYLYCSLCGTQWPCARQVCAFCGTQDSQCSFVFIEDDPARRADLCQTCQRYLKTIVTKRLTHALYLPLEEFITIDLDMLLLRQELI